MAYQFFFFLCVWQCAQLSVYIFKSLALSTYSKKNILKNCCEGTLKHNTKYVWDEFITQCVSTNKGEEK